MKVRALVRIVAKDEAGKKTVVLDPKVEHGPERAVQPIEDAAARRLIDEGYAEEVGADDTAPRKRAAKGPSTKTAPKKAAKKAAKKAPASRRQRSDEDLGIGGAAAALNGPATGNSEGSGGEGSGTGAE